ncbi:MAG TPA: hypothetical protein VGC53_06200 [Vicinamibacteria bacterium]|jgi:hypothetical protein
MEKKPGRELMQGERGSALVVVLLMLLLLLPVTLILARFVMHWQGGAALFHRMTGMEYAARAGFEEAGNRLAIEQIRLDLNGSMAFEVRGLEGHTARVRVGRQPDAVISLDGRVLDALEAAAADLTQVGLDPDMRRVRLFQKLEVCLVEVTVAGPGSLAGVRLWGVLVRDRGGTWRRAGLRMDRGFF